MNRPTHPELVKALSKDGLEILNSLGGRDAELIHMAMGVSGEAGELLDVIKKITIYRKPLDNALRLHVLEELGDLKFYMERIVQMFGFTWYEVEQHNIDKLLIRYGDMVYSNEAAQARRDKLNGE